MADLPDILKFPSPSGKTELRVAMLADDDPWFIARDVCDVLGTRTDDIRSMLDEDEVATINPGTIGIAGGRSPLIISESGFYSLVLRSRKPIAKRFKQWVTREVLPSIRKHGVFATPDMVDRMIADPDTTIRLLKTLKDEQDARKAVEGVVEEQKPKVDYAEKTTEGMELFLLTNVARYFGIGRSILTRMLLDDGMLYSRFIGGQRRNEPTDRARYGEYIVSVGPSNWRITSLGMEYIKNLIENQEDF